MLPHFGHAFKVTKHLTKSLYVATYYQTHTNVNSKITLQRCKRKSSKWYEWSKMPVYDVIALSIKIKLPLKRLLHWKWTIHKFSAAH